MSTLIWSECILFLFSKREGGMRVMCRIAGWNREPPANRIYSKVMVGM